MIRKSFQAETKALDESRGIVEAIVNVGAVLDRQDDVMEPGCWGAVIKSLHAGDAPWPAICWGHKNGMGTDLVVVGKVLEAEEIPPGNSRLPQAIQQAGGSALRIVGQYNLVTEAGRDAFSNVKGGYVTQWSVGFEPDQTKLRYEKGVRFVGVDGVKTWPEVSNVLLGASPGTHTVAVKALDGEALQEREQRSADRLAQALDIYAQVKSAQNTQAQREGAKYSIDTPDGPKYPINDCSDVSDAWGLRGNSDIPKDKVEAHVRRAANKLNCDGPWNNGGKADDPDLEEKESGLPELTGDEEQHMGPLNDALTAVKTLIQQELGEDYPEPDCVMRLTCIWQDLINWARGEAVEYTDYGAMPMLMSAYVRAGMATLTDKTAPPVEETKEEEPAVELPEWMRLAIETYNAAPESPQHSVPEHRDAEEQPLPEALRQRFGRHASWSDSLPRR